MFDIIDERDDILDAVDIDNRDDANKKSIDDWEDTFDVVEDNGDNLDTNKMTPSDGIGFFWHFNPDLPFFFSVAAIFGGVDEFFFVMVLSTNDS